MIEAATPLLAANPEGTDVTLTQGDVWRALVWKAEFAHLFVKPIKECRIVERLDNGFLREIHHEDSLGDDVLYERIFLDPLKSVRFLRLNGPVAGEIVNTISTEGDLALSFSFTFGVLGEKHASERELEYRQEFLDGYVIAGNATLEAARDYLRTGIDPTQVAAPEINASL